MTVLEKMFRGLAAALVLLAAQSASAEITNRAAGVADGQASGALGGERRSSVRAHSESVDTPGYRRSHVDQTGQSPWTEEEAATARRRLWVQRDSGPNPFRERGAAGRDGVGSTSAVPAQRTQTTGGFACEGKRYCREMASCAEARFYLSRCGVSRLDRDGDGVPCETICR